MMDRILDFPQQDVEHAMVPRSQVDWVSPETTLEELRAMMARAHTRYPVIDGEDTPVGVVHLADVLSHQASKGTGGTSSWSPSSSSVISGGSTSSRTWSSRRYAWART